MRAIVVFSYILTFGTSEYTNCGDDPVGCVNRYMYAFFPLLKLVCCFFFG